MNVIGRKFNSAGSLGLLNWMPDKMYLSILYRFRMGKPMHWKAPRLFSEKQQWLKVYDRKPIYTAMADKYEAKRLIADAVGEEFIIPTYGVWNSFEDIDFDALPDQFVLKCTHDSGGLSICRDKATFDREKARKKIVDSQHCNYFWNTREWPYKDIKPRIIAEKYMEDPKTKELRDYKFYCFDGEPRFLYVSRGLEDHTTANISFLTLDWEFAPYQRIDYPPFSTLPEKPEGFDTMLALCRQLSKGHAFLRVDLYQVGDKVYFSELTFSPCGGFMMFENPDHDRIIGDMLHLPR